MGPRDRVPVQLALEGVGRQTHCAILQAIHKVGSEGGIAQRYCAIMRPRFRMHRERKFFSNTKHLDTPDHQTPKITKTPRMNTSKTPQSLYHRNRGQGIGELRLSTASADPSLADTSSSRLASRRPSPSIPLWIRFRDWGNRSHRGRPRVDP